jgi:hypothetical protein
MSLKNLYHQLSQTPVSAKKVITPVMLAWGMFCIGFFAGSFFFLFERSGRPLNVTSGIYTPVIALEPASGSAGTSVTVRGEGWPAGSLVLIYVVAPDEMEILDYPIATAIADFEGRSIARFVFPSGSRWENQEVAVVIARTDDSRLPVQAIFDVESSISQP